MSDQDKKVNKVKSKLGDKPIPTSELKNAVEHDLSHERDARCVPIAHDIVKLLSKMDKMPVGSHVNDVELIKEGTYTPVVVELLKILIDKDVKITEITYIFSLVRQAIQYIESAIDETMNQQMNRVTELVYGLPHNKYDEITIANLNKVVSKKPLIEEVWRPILDQKEEKIDN